VTGDADVVTDPDLQLYGSGLLDSLATVSLIVAFEDAFGLVEISATKGLSSKAYRTPPAQLMTTTRPEPRNTDTARVSSDSVRCYGMSRRRVDRVNRKNLPLPHGVLITVERPE
jgi:hypothetical protein